MARDPDQIDDFPEDGGEARASTEGEIPIRNYAGERGNLPPKARPRPLADALRELPRQYFKVLSRPGPHVFLEEQDKASWDIIWAQMILVTVLVCW